MTSHRDQPAPVGGPSTQELLIINDPFRLAIAGSWLEEPLAVQAAPNSAITFEALDSGRFDNGETRVRIRADAQGVAAARFYIPRPGGYRVLVKAPGTIGPAQFDIQGVTRKFHDDVMSGRYERHYLAKHADIAKRRGEAAAVNDTSHRRQAPPNQD